MNYRKRVVLALGCIFLLIAALCVPAAAQATRYGTAQVTALKDDGSGKPSMMGAMLASDCKLEQSDGVVFALLTFQDASIMFVPVKAGDVAPVQTYDGDTAFSTEELSSGNGHYTVRVRVPDLERDTLLSMTAMNTTRKVLLHVSQVAWEAQPTTASSTRTAFITTTTQAASELPAAVPVTESTTVITTTITSPKTTTERMTTEIVPTTIAEQPQSKAIFPILAGAAGVVILVLAGVVLLPRQRSKRK